MLYRFHDLDLDTLKRSLEHFAQTVIARYEPTVEKAARPASVGPG